MEAFDKSDIFFIVLARTQEGVAEKAFELRKLGVPFIVICGEKMNYPEVIYRQKKGKFDAINFAAKFIGKNIKIVCLNDVDTKLFNFEQALEVMRDRNAGLVFCKVKVNGGPQVQFYSLMDKIRRYVPITSSGELMLIRKKVFDKILPIPPCKTEDNYISFKVTELGYPVLFCEDCWVETKRTQTLEEESQYKTRTVTGIYQALSFTKTAPLVRFFYLSLPFITPLLLLQGKRGAAWTKGIIQGVTNFLRGDKEGAFEKIAG
ncbi:glycosyltransferase family 2 protein [Candidatus Bathyarchaeota archaeon]|nr:glycosyltransferase family 2 protein [Candidatus Bathyarchaeota archaeon]